jgi:hypothetical protein
MQNGKLAAAAGAASIAAITPIAIKAHKDLRIAFSIPDFNRRLAFKQTGFDAPGQFTFARWRARNFDALAWINARSQGVASIDAKLTRRQYRIFDCGSGYRLEWQRHERIFAGWVTGPRSPLLLLP